MIVCLCAAAAAAAAAAAVVFVAWFMIVFVKSQHQIPVLDLQTTITNSCLTVVYMHVYPVIILATNGAPLEW